MLSDAGFERNGYGLQAFLIDKIREVDASLVNYIDFDSEAGAISIIIEPVKEKKIIKQIINDILLIDEWKIN